MPVSDVTGLLVLYIRGEGTDKGGYNLSMGWDGEMRGSVRIHLT
jgi:hypothetical protein